MLIGDKMRTLRKEHHLTFAQLSEKTGVSVSFLSDIERGRTTPSISTITKIAKAFNVNPASFLGEEYETLCPDYIDEFIESYGLSESFASLFRVLQVGGNYPRAEDLQETYLYLKRLLVS